LMFDDLGLVEQFIQDVCVFELDQVEANIFQAECDEGWLSG
jgi:hypothetical protein